MSDYTTFLTAENYFSVESNMQYMSVSQFKTFEDCEFMGLEEARGHYQRPATPSLLIGSYVDAHFDRSLDLFKAQHPEIFKRDGSLKAEYIKADEIINRVEQDPFFMKYMDGEKQVIMTGEIAEVPVKVKIDVFHPGKAIVDLKVMRDFQPVYVPASGRMNFIEGWRYTLQGAVYQEVVFQNTGNRLPFFIVAATKETVTDFGVFEVPQEAMDAQLEIFKAFAPRYQMLKKGLDEPIRCEHCDACKQTKKLDHIITWEELGQYGT